MTNSNSETRKPPAPLERIAGFDVRPGLYQLNGATALPDGAVNFTIHSSGATGCELLLFHPKETEPYAVIPIPNRYRIGDVWSMMVYHLDIATFEYAYRLDGPWDPKNGLRFDRKNVLLDIYAKSVTGQNVWGKKQDQNGFYKARVVKSGFDWGDAEFSRQPMEDLVIYELHVRGFTRHPSSGVEGPGTFHGLMEKIPYLRDLGVNAVELMPVFEFDETRDQRVVNGRTLLDYWGDNPISFFAPNTSYAMRHETTENGNELKKLIRELNRNGIECFLDVVFNHTAEGNEYGPVISFKGFDNNVYYMLTPDGYYYNFSGCGNTLNCNHPVMQSIILDCLRYWVTDYHVAGFRFDLASILGRDENGAPLSNPPLLKNLAYDPILKNVKLIAEAWDAGGLYQVGSFPSWKRWAEWNGRYRDDMRNFLKGDLSLGSTAAARITGSRDLYNPAFRGGNASVNFLNCHDGFTLWDMYSYSRKHNESNGWKNLDGTDDNRSWNCGAEGPTDDPDIRALRRKMCRNAMTVLLMSRGTPMFFAGDEFLNSQQGNNNTYCQDSEISWLNWQDLDRNYDFFQYVRHLIAFRRSHRIVRAYGSEGAFGLPDLSTRCPDSASQILRVVYAGLDDEGVEDAVCLLINVFWETQWLDLPSLPGKRGWSIAFDSSLRYLKEGYALPDSRQSVPSGQWVEMEPRSVLVLTPAGKPEETAQEEPDC